MQRLRTDDSGASRRLLPIFLLGLALLGGPTACGDTVARNGGSDQPLVTPADDAPTDADGTPAPETAARADAFPDEPIPEGAAAGWRLADEESPYLRQHADNLVAWYPWGEEAFDKAKALDKPVFLSIGYSSCHWCHVMEHETFMDAESARLLNEHFVSIKVDREQRPDVDSRYMTALQIMTRGGGWPASLFLTPEGKPFAGGTYFPPTPKGGLPGFRDVLASIQQTWTEDRPRVDEVSGQLGGLLGADDLPLAQPGWDARGTLDRGTNVLTGSLDSTLGGTHGAPKFPPSMLLRFLMRQHLRTGVTVVEIVETTLDGMANGGMHDQLAGGFHRYSVDAQWHAPHFEKMLYDNALLLATYAEAWALTERPRWADTARFTWRWLDTEMREPDTGLYYSALDADSLPFDEQGQALPNTHPEEGEYYIWTEAELIGTLGETDGRAAAMLFNATPQGNFERGRSILRPMRSLYDLAQNPPTGMPKAEAFTAWLQGVRTSLLAERARRPAPFRDDKCLAGWNGLLLSGLARAATLLPDEAMADETARLSRALLGFLSDDPSDRALGEQRPGLAHQWYEGRFSGEGDLFDHAAVATGLLDAYELTGDPELMVHAVLLTRALLDRFEEPEAGGFYDTTGADKLLPGRGRDVYDGAVPSGSSLAITLLARLAPLDDSGRFAASAEAALARLGPMADRSPRAFPAMLVALDAWHGPLAEIVLHGQGDEHEAMLRLVRGSLMPAALVVPDAGKLAEVLQGVFPEEPSLLAGRRAPDGEARAWVCVRGACLLPAKDVGTLATQLQAVVKR